jgi:transcriptional repressor NrdR
VLESRVADAGDAMRRRRECLACAYRFTTYERTDQPVLWVAKHEGSAEPFDRAKVMHGLVRACSKRHVPRERLEALTVEIEAQLRARCVKEIDSDEIGELALEGLRGIDHVAYVRFASVYRAFESIEEFHDVLEWCRVAPAGAGEPSPVAAAG